MSRLTLKDPPPRPDLQELLLKAKDFKMTPEMYAAQRRSWVIGNVGLANPDRPREDIAKAYDEMLKTYQPPIIVEIEKTIQVAPFPTKHLIGFILLMIIMFLGWYMSIR